MQVGLKNIVSSFPKSQMGGGGGEILSVTVWDSDTKWVDRLEGDNWQVLKPKTR